VIYVDSFQGLIHNLYPSKEKAWQLESVLGIYDYLTSYGMHLKKPEKRWLKGEALPSLQVSARTQADNAPHLDSFFLALNFAGSGALVSARRPDEFMRSRAAARKHRLFGPEELGSLKNSLRQWLTGVGT